MRVCAPICRYLAIVKLRYILSSVLCQLLRAKKSRTIGTIGRLELRPINARSQYNQSVKHTKKGRFAKCAPYVTIKHK